MSDPVRIGDVAKLISGGPKMTVEFVDGAYAKCVWFTSEAGQRWIGPIRESFFVDQLVRFEEPPQ